MTQNCKATGEALKQFKATATAAIWVNIRNVKVYNKKTCRQYAIAKNALCIHNAWTANDLNYMRQTYL